MHVARSGKKFTSHAFVDAHVPCSRWESQLWDFDLDDATEGQAAVRIWPDGSFASLRRGVMNGGEEGIGPYYKSTENARGWLDINGRFVSRTRIRGTMRAWSSDGCDSGWMPYRARYLRTGWKPYLDRT